MTPTTTRSERQRRPTREQTRERLIDAAADVFIEHGIGAASVDDIAAAAGFSRGAFYSNFADKDELVLALLDTMSRESAAELEAMVEQNPKPTDFLAAYRKALFDPDRPSRRHHPVLATELMLFAMRNPTAQPMLRARLNRAHNAVYRTLEAQAEALGLGPATNRHAIAAMINAMDDGFGLHAMIDPTRDTISEFAQAIEFLGEAATAIAFVHEQKNNRAPKPAPTGQRRSAKSP